MSAECFRDGCCFVIGRKQVSIHDCTRPEEGGARRRIAACPAAGSRMPGGSLRRTSGHTRAMRVRDKETRECGHSACDGGCGRPRAVELGRGGVDAFLSWRLTSILAGPRGSPFGGLAAPFLYVADVVLALYWTMRSGDRSPCCCCLPASLGLGHVSKFFRPEAQPALTSSPAETGTLARAELYV